MARADYYTTLERCLFLVIADDSMAISGIDTLLKQRLVDLRSLSHEPVDIVSQAMEAFRNIYQTPADNLDAARSDYDICSFLICDILQYSKNAGFISTSERARDFFEKGKAVGR